MTQPRPPVPPNPAPGRRRLTREQRAVADRVLERLRAHARVWTTECEGDSSPPPFPGKSPHDLEVDMGLVGLRPRVEWLLEHLVAEGSLEVASRKPWPGTTRLRVLYRPKGTADGIEKK